MRPILKYHGGKWRLAPWIISHFPKHRSYVEPFCGAASVLLRKRKVQNEVLNDLNGRLVSLFRILRDPQQAAALKKQILLTPCAFDEYLEAREISADPIEDARRMIILGHQSHGGTGVSGGKLSGWRRGQRKDRDRSSADEWADIHLYIDAWCDRLRSVFLENNSAVNVIKQWDSEETLFYVDPPYIASTRHGTGNRGYAFEMDDRQHVELSELLHNLKGQVVLSGYNSNIYDELYGDWKKFEKKAMADHAKPAIECIWISPAGRKPEFNYKSKDGLF